MWARIASLAAVLVSLSSATEAGTVRGTVVDREGKPAAGAKVRAAKLGVSEPADVREGTADGSGAFAIEAAPGRWIVFALRGNEGGRAGYESLANIEEGKPDPGPMTVRLGPPATLQGRLLDAETGRPIAGGFFATDDARRLAVDDRGRFEAPGLDLTNHEAYPLCPGYERRRILFDTTGRPDAEWVLRHPGAGTVVGRVLDAEGRPIPGAVVGLNTSGTIFSGAALWERCSADGRYVYDGKPLGRAGRLSARAPGYQAEDREDVVPLDAAVPTEVDFALRPDPTKPKEVADAAKPAAPDPNRRAISGIVFGPEGKPAASALVRWGLRFGSNEIHETKTDADGRFRLEGVPDAAEILSVMAKGLAPAFPMAEAGGDRQLEIKLKPGTTIRGRVLDEAGAPIESARVAPQIANPKPNWMGFVYLDELVATTDREGRFTLLGMPKGATCDVIAGDRSALHQRPLSAADESKNVFTLLGGGAIRGRVVDPAGNPVRNFRIQVGIPKGAKPGEPVGGYFAGYSGIGLSFTRDDGEFTIGGLTAGNLHRLTVIAGELGAAEVDRVEAPTIGRLGPADALTIKLGPPHALRVRVFEAGGRLVPGARVTLIQTEGQGRFRWDSGSWEDNVTAPVDDRGWAEFPGLAFGRGTVVVRARGFGRMKLDWAKDEEEFEVLLEPEAKLAGTLLDEAGRPLLGARLLLSWGRGEMTNVAVGEKDGYFVADGLGSGKYRLNVRLGDGPAPVNESIELEPGKELFREIRIKRPNLPASK